MSVVRYSFALFLTASGLWAQAPASLTVTKATTSEVDLTWTGTSSSYSVQRRVLGGSYQTIATASAAQYADTTVDPYTDYQYQVLAGTAASNQVSVGPPPPGFNNIAPAPLIAGNAITGYGDDASLAFDSNGDPSFAFLYDDPNQDGSTVDSALLFRSWNRAQFTWNPIVTVSTVGDITSNTRDSVSLAYDPSTSTFVIASEFISGNLYGIKIFVSADLGKTWTTKQSYSSGATAFYAPSVALLNGNIYFAVIVDTVGVRFYSGTLSAAPTTWVLKTPTKPANTDIALFGTGASLALDSTGTPAVAYWVSDTRSSQSYNDVLLFWRPLSAGAPVVVTDTQNNQSDVAVKMRFFGTNPRIVFHAQRNDGDFGVGVHFVRSDDGGTTWQAPVLIPPDGHSSTDYPFDLALDSQGHAAIAMGRNGGSGDDLCGDPKVSRSTDLVHWTTCAVADISVTGKFDVFPGALQIAFGGNDKLFLLWKDISSSDSGVGILFYREPPAGTGNAPVIQAPPSGRPQVSDGAGFRSNIVAGSWVTIFGANFADAPAIWSNLDFTHGLPTLLAGIQVKINGQLAATYYTQSDQVNVQAPGNISGPVTVQVIKNGIASNTVTATAVAHAPGLFAYSVDQKNFYPAAVYPDGTLVGDPAIVGTSVPNRKAHGGDIVQLYSTGLGPEPGGVLVTATGFPDALSVTLTLGSTTITTPNPVTFLVAPGEFQTNINIPAGLAPGNYTITLTTGGVSSQPGITLPVGP